MREPVIPRAGATRHSIEMSKTEVSQIFKKYVDDMKKTLLPGQEGKKWAYYKSCAEAKMKLEAGHRFIAGAIWTIGFSSSATVCYRSSAGCNTTRRAALSSGFRSSPTGHSECAGMAESCLRRASRPPQNATVSWSIAKIRGRTLAIRPLCYRAWDQSSQSQSKDWDAHCETVCKRMGHWSAGNGQL